MTEYHASKSGLFMPGNLTKLGGFGSLTGVNAAPVNPGVTVGAAGTPVFGGFLETNESSPDLVGQQKYVTISNMLANTAIVGAGVRFFLNLIAAAEWRFVPADDGPEAQRFAELTEAALTGTRTPWHRIVRRTAMFRFYGFSLQEWTEKRGIGGPPSMFPDRSRFNQSERQGRRSGSGLVGVNARQMSTRGLLDANAVGFLDIQPRPQQTIEEWDVANDGYVRGVTQRSPQTQEEIYIPRSKMVYGVDDTLNDSPEGLGIFRQMVEVNRRLKRLEQLEGWGYENDLRGTPIGKAPINAMNRAVEAGSLDASERDSAIASLRMFLQKHIRNPNLAFMMDSAPYFSVDDASTPSNQAQWDISLLSSITNGLDGVANAIDRLMREIAVLIGIEGLLLGSGERGSQALSRDKTSNLLVVVDGVLLELREIMSRDLVDYLFLRNGWPMELRPALTTRAMRIRDPEVVARGLRDLAAAGAPVGPDDQEVVDEVTEMFGLESAPDLQAGAAREEELMLRSTDGGDDAE